MSDNGEPKLSKKQLKKLEKQKKKEEARLEREAQELARKQAILDSVSEFYGYRPLAEVVSDDNPVREYIELDSFTEELINKDTWIRARIHRKKAVSSKLTFLILRSRYTIMQAVVDSDNVPVDVVKLCAKIPNESIVDIYGCAIPPAVPVESSSYDNMEFRVKKLFIVSEAIPELPLQIEDAGRSTAILEAQKAEVEAISDRMSEIRIQIESADEAKKAELEAMIDQLQEEKSRANRYPRVDQSTRLDYRVLDMRTPANLAIFKLQSALCNSFRAQLLANNFVEIHTPKLLGVPSEGGSEVFEVKYFDTTAYLAQSPQLYKQMCIAGDFRGVFEIGPVFRAEKSDTHRHLTEFIGLDLEMEFKQHYHEVLQFIGKTLINIFKDIEANFQTELGVVNEQYPFEPIVYSEEPLILNFSHGIELLHEAGIEQDPMGDLGSEAEKALGAIVKEKYGTDFYILDKYPVDERAFYTMPDPENPEYGNAYDIFIRGEEISSGAQRIHERALLEERATKKGVTNLAPLEKYVEAFTFGASPHAGCGLGLERVLFLYLNLGNCRKTCLFPRDPYRLTP
eukprot:TRINITY_DN607_c1_g1_i1.p1 TRINITY_DN607_c1_g1~~TRINITY_DN607_c1_g1_i1.p1  ORF type:complete len:585 (-),score=163.24 TRINITY_DN607_c1_g1_i1:96-1802(-)